MDEELLNTALSDLLENMGSAKSFVIEQAPEVAQQLLTYNMTQALIGAIICFILAMAMIVIGFVIMKKEEDAFPLLMCGLLSLIPIAIMVTASGTALKIWLAPKLYILEYAAQLVD